MGEGDGGVRDELDRDGSVTKTSQKNFMTGF